MPVVATRLRPPRRNAKAVRREKLPALLAQLSSRRLLFACAPAGYGKSLLMVQLYDELQAWQKELAWVSAADLDGSLSDMALHCAAALAIPELEGAIDALLSTQHGATPESISGVMCNELERAACERYLFVDDIHAVRETPAERLLACLLRDAPAQIHFVLGSRTEPGFSIARLRAQGELVEVGAATLRFSADEARVFLTDSGVDAGDNELIALALEKTEGWAAGLQLVSLSINSGDDGADRIKALSGEVRSINAFMADDVFDAQSDEVQSFLLHTSVLRQFCPALCDEIGARGGGHEIVRFLERRGLFIFALDQQGQWYRYHHLFRRFLQQRLLETDPSLVPELHLRAATWYRANGLIEEALFHALAIRAFEYAADILDAICTDLFYQGSLWSLMGWIKQIPDSVLGEHPRIQLARAWFLILEWRFEEASGILDAVRAHIETMTRSGAMSLDESSKFHRLYLHRKMMLAEFSDDMATVERFCVDLIADFPDEDPYARGTLETSLAFAQREHYRLDSIDRLDKAARDYYERAGRAFVLIWHESLIGPAFFQRGDLELAARGYETAIHIAQRIGGESGPLASIPSVLLADLRLERGEYREAKAALDKYLPLSGELGLVDHLVAAFVGRARLAALEGDSATAHEVLVRGTRFASARSFDRLFWALTAERLRQAVRRNDIEEALRIAAAANLPREAEALCPADDVTTRTELMAITWIRLALAQGSSKEAEALARKWYTFAERRSCMRTQIRMAILMVAARLMAGDRKGATRALLQVDEQAAPRGMVLGFLEEGHAVKQAIASLYNLPDLPRSDLELSDALKTAFGTGRHRIGQPSRLLPESPSDDGGAVVSGRLSQREMDILKLVARSLQNKEIADRLGLTEGSVKWYMQQIYAKLGVRRRLQAFRTAEALGLIDRSR
jgi:LuxR family transcriptional regulator, maltose regulon positive regulatory protein